MAKTKTSRKRAFSFDAIPPQRLRRGAAVVAHDPKTALRDRKLVIDALTEALTDGDAQAFAEAYTGFFKAAYEPCLFVSLRATRTPHSRQAVIDSFSEKLQAALAQDPKKYSCHWVLQLMLISKKQK